jgi:predicted aldo/keto reductase-like oxidoreductase
MLCYNPVDSEDVADEILPMAKDADMGTIIMKPLSGGQLVYPKEERKAGLGGEDAIVAGCLRYVMQDPNCDVVIPGMQALHEVEENVAVAENFEPLNEDEHSELMSRIADLPGELRYGQVCLRCGYCMPCTVGINIPQVLKAARMKDSYDERLEHVADEIWECLEVTPDECVECAQCEERCPAGIDIVSQMRKTLELFDVA